MTAYVNLSDGELLAQLQALAEEGRRRLEHLVIDAERSGDSLRRAFVFGEKLEDALFRSSGRSVYNLRGDLKEIAQTRPDEANSQPWDDFLAEHPELRGDETRSSSPPQLDMGIVDDEDVLTAVEEAIRQSTAHNDARERDDGSGIPPALLARRRDAPGGVGASDVAQVLACRDSLTERFSVTQSDRIKVGHRLAKLARAGSLTRISRPYEGPTYVLAEGGDDA